MMRPAEFAELTAFAAVAEARSFRAAASRLNLRPSTLSHSVRALEQRLGVRLLARTTRSVAPTEAGCALLASIGPALARLDGAMEDVNAHRASPRGTLRLSVPQHGAAVVLGPKLGAFAREFPDVTLDISVDDAFVDIVRDGFDAGIRIGGSVSDGMTAVLVSAPQRAAVVASPAYWAAHPPPATPNDLAAHRCINHRYGAGRSLHRWLFRKEGAQLEVSFGGPLNLDSDTLIRMALLDGVGVAMTAESYVADDVAAGRLSRVLEDWCPPMYSYYLYHPSQRLPSASLRALIRTVAWDGRGPH